MKGENVVNPAGGGIRDGIRKTYEGVDAGMGGSGAGHILVVDDHAGLLQIVARMLSSSGFQVRTAGDGRKALDLFSRMPIALVLTDLEMPEMDGLTLARKMKSSRPEVPVVMMTGADEETIRVVKEDPGVQIVLRKPFQWVDLEKAVLNALQITEPGGRWSAGPGTAGPLPVRGVS